MNERTNISLRFEENYKNLKLITVSQGNNNKVLFKLLNMMMNRH